MGHTVGCMRLTRRNALIGLGTVAAGAGVIGGTGAFTSVQADRTVSVSTTGDASAALGILPDTDAGDGNPQNGTLTDNAQGYTNANGVASLNDDTLSITIDSLNLDATTSIENLFIIVNNGTQNVDLDFQLTATSGSISDIVGSGGSIDLIVENDSDTYTLSDGDWQPTTDDSAISLPQGQFSDAFGLKFEVDDNTATSSTVSLELTIRAQA